MEIEVNSPRDISVNQDGHHFFAYLHQMVAATSRAGRTVEYGPQNWPITARVLTETFNKTIHFSFDCRLAAAKLNMETALEDAEYMAEELERWLAPLL